VAPSDDELTEDAIDDDEPDEMYFEPSYPGDLPGKSGDGVYDRYFADLLGTVVGWMLRLHGDPGSAVERTCVLAGLSGRRDALVRRPRHQATPEWDTESRLLDALVELFAMPSAPTVEELTAMMDRLLWDDSKGTLRIRLAGEGVLLLLGDRLRADPAGSGLAQDVLNQVTELRDFIADIYQEIAVKRLKATLRHVRGLVALDGRG